MSTYLSTKGVKIQNLASDPTLIEGVVWYNTATSVLKFYNGSSTQTVTTS